MTQFYQTTLGHSKGPFTIQETAPSLTTYPFKVEENMIKVRSGSDVVIPNIWLRDNCQCSSCMHKATKQRLLDTFQIPRDITIRSSEIDPEGVRVKWSDGHESHYTADFLSSSHMSYLQRAKVRQDLVNIKLWDESIAQRPPIVSYDNFHDKDGVKDVLDKIRTFGFCYIDQLPVSPEATEKALERIAFIRPTHYGGFYDFTADLASKDTAYTNIYLEAHTDTTYFSDPAGLQAFHLLEHSGGEGGTSLLVDGFKVAKDLNHLDREAYHILSTVNVHSHASGNEGISIQPYRGFPVFQHDPETGILLQIRWNSSDRAGVALPVDQVEEWYDAARKWNDLLKKNENEYWCQLTPGRLVVFDNWRVLHGRSAFTGKRRICGGYINRDDWISKHKMLHFGQDAVMKHLPTG
ncbi:Trimethyllysine dioxygenase [Lindgomyces ingoldianus]|uniref:Trimethyllysine dioxygenase n=1 Tax=Lindgomyces ingoldianus TaxID=673940 RepID=A0ACB6R3Z6_9PLEO|nr:Trimethyllysine dioxygenase [Lindgomyces ingoldianus]KAF2473151.1 Trimethyllysine dioxygenase [Lindgomyces ingoldianus]